MCRVPRNRSAPPCSVVPVLTYPDVADAVDWLTRVFGWEPQAKGADSADD
jgi:hypothetical protein